MEVTTNLGSKWVLSTGYDTNDCLSVQGIGTRATTEPVESEGSDQQMDPSLVEVSLEKQLDKRGLLQTTSASCDSIGTCKATSFNSLGTSRVSALRHLLKVDTS